MAANRDKGTNFFFENRFNFYPDSSREELSQSIVDLRRQHQVRQLTFPASELLMNPQSAEHLKGSDALGHPRDVNFSAGRDKQSLVVVSPRQSSYRPLNTNPTITLSGKTKVSLPLE